MDADIQLKPKINLKNNILQRPKFTKMLEIEVGNQCSLT